MFSCINIFRNKIEEPDLVGFTMHVVDGDHKWQFQLVERTDKLRALADRLEVFPKDRTDVYIWEQGSEYPEDREKHFFRFRVFATNALGQCAIQIRFNNNKGLPDKKIVEFCIDTDAAQIKLLGQLVREFSGLKHEVLLWGGNYSGLYESMNDIFKNDVKVNPLESKDDVVAPQFVITRMRILNIEERALKKLKAKKANEETCSFCGKPVSETERMIASEISNVFICEECIKNCGDLLNN